MTVCQINQRFWGNIIRANTHSDPEQVHEESLIPGSQERPAPSDPPFTVAEGPVRPGFD
jgi:hypothetical protein